MSVEKKNPYKFTIAFNSRSPVHKRTADILNQTKDKADFIAKAVSYYLGISAGFMNESEEEDGLNAYFQKIIKEEVRKAMVPIKVPSKYSPTILNEKSDEIMFEEESIEIELAEGFVNAMNMLRKD